MNSKFAYEEELKDYFKVRNLFGELRDEPDSTKERALANLGITKEMLETLKELTTERASQQLQNSNNGD